MATNTQVNHLVSMMRNELVTCNERSVRCELRRNELQHRQNQLFKVLTEALKKYERMGFSIVFTAAIHSVSSAAKRRRLSLERTVSGS